MKSVSLLLLQMHCCMSFAQEEGFLSKSKVLSDVGVKIIPVQISNGLILPILEPEASARLFLLEQGGLAELQKNAKARMEKLKVRTCGDKGRAYSWLKKDGTPPDGLFAVVGAISEGLQIRWIPASVLKSAGAPECAIYNKNYKLSKFTMTSIDGLEYKVFLLNKRVTNS